MAYHNREEPALREAREAVSWNVAMKNSDLISDLIYRTTMAELSGDIDTQFFCLRALRNNVNYGLKAPEIADLDLLELAYYKSKKIINALSKSKQKQKLSFVTNLRFKILRAYYRKVMDVLFSMGYFPRKENRENMGF